MPVITRACCGTGTAFRADGARRRRGASPTAALLLSLSIACGGTRARVFRGAHEREIRLESYRRGIFLGSCGPATRSVRWEYSFTLRGDGPVFAPSAIEMRDGQLARVEVRAGTIILAERLLTIALSMARDGRTAPFPYNGTYRIGR